MSDIDWNDPHARQAESRRVRALGFFVRVRDMPSRKHRPYRMCWRCHLHEVAAGPARRLADMENRSPRPNRGGWALSPLSRWVVAIRGTARVLITDSLRSKHPVTHSRLLRACVDSDMVSVAEWLNDHLCLTDFSCEDGRYAPSLPDGMEGWPTALPYVTLVEQTWPSVREYLNDGKWTIAYAETGHYDVALKAARESDAAVVLGDGRKLWFFAHPFDLFPEAEGYRA